MVWLRWVVYFGLYISWTVSWDWVFGHVSQDTLFPVLWYGVIYREGRQISLYENAMKQPLTAVLVDSLGQVQVLVPWQHRGQGTGCVRLKSCKVQGFWRSPNPPVAEVKEAKAATTELQATLVHTWRIIPGTCKWLVSPPCTNHGKAIWKRNNPRLIHHGY